MRRYDFTPRYEELRLDKGLRQDAVAKVLNVKRNTYSKWENCINDMTLEKCNELANYYGSSIDYLLGISHQYSCDNTRNTIDLKILPKRLYELRKEKKLSQEELCEKLGFLQRVYSYYETGKRVPKTFKILIIAQFYEVSADYIVGRTDNKEIK